MLVATNMSTTQICTAYEGCSLLVVLVVLFGQDNGWPRLNITVLCQHLHLHATASGSSAVLKPISSNVLSSALLT